VGDSQALSNNQLFLDDIAPVEREAIVSPPTEIVSCSFSLRTYGPARANVTQFNSVPDKVTLLPPFTLPRSAEMARGYKTLPAVALNPYDLFYLAVFVFRHRLECK